MRSDEKVVVLYDLASKPPAKCCSPNCWKTRAALNFKGLEYKTIWLERPDVKETLQPLGIPGNRPEDYFLEYTCPTVQLPDGKCVMESSRIAQELEKLQPLPSLLLDGPWERVQRAVSKMLIALMPMLFYKARDRLSERSAEYYESSRKAVFGMGLDELAESEAAMNAWKNAEAGIREVGSLLETTDSGPYVMGKTASYCDIILAAGWHYLHELDPPTLERLYTYNPAFEKHYNACRMWFQRDSY